MMHIFCQIAYFTVSLYDSQLGLHDNELHQKYTEMETKTCLHPDKIVLHKQIFQLK